MALIYFNYLISISAPECGLVGLYRVIALSRDHLQVALAPIPLVNDKTTGKAVQKNSAVTGTLQFKGISSLVIHPMALLKTLEEQESIFSVELVQPVRSMRNPKTLSQESKAIYDYRVGLMKPFFRHDYLSKALFSGTGIGSIVSDIHRKNGASRTLIYALFGLLCIRGFDGAALMPSFDLCGAPGMKRPVGAGRKKAGRKTNRERIGNSEPYPQRGVTEADFAQILKLYKQIKSPKMTDVAVYYRIVDTLYVRAFKPTKNGMESVLPAQGTFPNLRQFRHIIRSGTDTIERLKLNTTLGHFNRNQRGMSGKAWHNVAGPGHVYAIDSTIADIYLRSSINRAWVCGRPVVYIMVDVWSSAVVGFYVCWTGPSWPMAKVALFSACANRELIASQWGISEQIYLDPWPTLPFEWLCDRGEYLSLGASQSALDLMFSLAYNPSYRPDLKGLVEVLHRIAKDVQYPFLPGAMDARRKELELKGVDRNASALILREYVQHLTIVFNNYNHALTQGNRLDTDMIADNVDPSPAGLWQWGHEVGLGYRKSTPESKLITELLPSGPASITPKGLYFSGLPYQADIANKEQWSTLARNLGSYQEPVHYFPGSNAKIWLPGGSDGLTAFDLSSDARAKKHLSFEEWLDGLMIDKIKSQDREYLKTYQAIATRQKIQAIAEHAKAQTAEAELAYAGEKPNLHEAKQLEAVQTQQVPVAAPDPSAAPAIDFSMTDYTEQMLELMALSLKGGGDAK